LVPITKNSNKLKEGERWSSTLGNGFVFIVKDSDQESSQHFTFGIPSMKRFGQIGVLIDSLQGVFNWLVSKQDQEMMQNFVDRFKVYLYSKFNIDADDMWDNCQTWFKMNPVASILFYVGSFLFLLKRGRQVLKVFLQVLKVLTMRRVLVSVWDEIVTENTADHRSKL